MEQKDYKWEILLELLKNENHVRGLAKSLNTNHMAMVRKIKELSNANVVDYTLKGKNKVYSLKKNIETRMHVFMAENYKLLKILKKYPYLRGVIEKIQKNKEAKLAILFGSHTKEIARSDSYIDIYIETTNNKLKKEIEKISTKISLKIGKYDKSNFLIKEIDKNHAIIKGIEKYYEKKGFFD